jgi:hypothetical protein
MVQRLVKYLFLMLSFVVLTANAQSTPPTTATVEEWMVSAIFTSGGESENVNEAMQVAFDGNDIYFNFPNPIQGNTWMKGTRNGTTVTFAKGQKVGSYGGRTVYYVGLGENNTLCDMVFTYDEANSQFVLGDMYLVLNGSLTENSALGYFSPVVIMKENASSDTTQDYVLTGKNVNPYDESQYEELSEDVKVVVDGSNISIQGLSAFDPSLWLQGTIDGSAATFAKRQSAGTYNTTQLYMIGYDGKECDITFSYDATTRVLVAQQYILCVTSDGNTYQMLTDIVLSPKSGAQPVQPEVVTPPAGLQTTPYVFTGNKMLYNDQGEYTGYEEVKRNARVGFHSSSEVYIQGLCEQLPEAWVKGTVSDGAFGDKDVTVAAGQYYGQYGLYPLYIVARYGNELTDMKLVYDPQTREFKNEGGVYMVLNVMPNQPAPIEIYATVSLTPGTLSGIKDVEKVKADSATSYYNLSGQRVKNPSKGIFIVNGKKVLK